MKLKPAGACLSVVMLATGAAGCSTSGGGGSSGGVDTGATFAMTAKDTAAKALKDGKTLKATASTSSTNLIDYDQNTAKAVDPASFSIKKNAKGGVDVTVNGKTTSFAKADEYVEEDGKRFGWEKDVPDTDYKGLFSYSGTIDETLNGTGDYKYAQLWQYTLDEGSNSTRGVAVVGTETKPDALKGKANATYKGWASAETRLTDDRKSRARVAGDLELAANFEKGSVSGKITNLGMQTRDGNTGWTDWADADGSIKLEKTNIVGNGYDGKLSGDAAFNNFIDGDLNGSTYSGRFYGPKAEETAGVLKLKGTSEGSTFVGTGAFVAKAQ